MLSEDCWRQHWLLSNQSLTLQNTEVRFLLGSGSCCCYISVDGLHKVLTDCPTWGRIAQSHSRWKHSFLLLWSIFWELSLHRLNSFIHCFFADASDARTAIESKSYPVVGELVRCLRAPSLFHGPWVQFPAPTWQLTTILSSSSRRSGASSGFQGDCMHTVHRHACR